MFETLLCEWSLKRSGRYLLVFETQSCFSSVNNSHYHDCRRNSCEKVAAPFGYFSVESPGKMPSLKSSVLCFRASSLVEMFKVISHTGASSDIDRKPSIITRNT